MTIQGISLEQEVEALSDRIHEILRASRNGQGSRPSRLVQHLPDEWMLLAAWLEMRKRMRLSGRHGPSTARLEDLDNRTIRNLARQYIGFLLDDHFHMELHDLSISRHPYLTPPIEEPHKILDDLGDGLPF